jgi:hypothetical protein
MWTCPKCREELEESFDKCWSCGTGQDGTPTDEPRVYDEGRKSAKKSSRWVDSPIKVWLRSWIIACVMLIGSQHVFSDWGYTVRTEMLPTIRQIEAVCGLVLFISSVFYAKTGILKWLGIIVSIIAMGLLFLPVLAN